jgi:hypothetical protein
MTLAELQRDFRSWLVEESDDAAKRLTGDARAGLFVYQNNYRAQLVGCLEASFPLVRKWLGDEAFLHAAIVHIGKHPPHAWTLDAYADGFGATLAEVFPDNPDLHELAWIEHALAEAFVAADATPVSVAALADIDWSTARIRLAPSLRSRVATTNAQSVWSALWTDQAMPESEMLDAPRALLVWRREFTSCLKEMDAIEHEALLQLQGDGSFAALCDLLVARLGETEGVERSGALLAEWLRDELIAGVDDTPPAPHS